VKNGAPPLGGLDFDQGVTSSCWRGVGSALPPPASLPAAVRLNDPHIVPSGVNQPRFPVFFPTPAPASQAIQRAQGLEAQLSEAALRALCANFEAAGLRLSMVTTEASKAATATVPIIVATGSWRAALRPC
jgi:hypothetical protein